MEEIGLFDAKTNLSKIAQRVQQTGQAVTLTKHGQPYVDLVPHQVTPSRKRSKALVLAELAALRKELHKTDFATIKADIEDGRP